MTESPSLTALLVLRARLAGAKERIRASVGATTPEVDADKHAALVLAEVERARENALRDFVRQQTEAAGSPDEVSASGFETQGG